jgi:hypothetical protein
VPCATHPAVPCNPEPLVVVVPHQHDGMLLLHRRGCRVTPLQHSTISHQILQDSWRAFTILMWKANPALGSHATVFGEL